MIYEPTASEACLGQTNENTNISRAAPSQYEKGTSRSNMESTSAHVAFFSDERAGSPLDARANQYSIAPIVQASKVHRGWVYHSLRLLTSRTVNREPSLYHGCRVPSSTKCPQRPSCSKPRILTWDRYMAQYIRKIRTQLERSSSSMRQLLR
jgi:hypothetical protein